MLFWIFKKISYNLGNKGFRFIKNFVDQLPIVIDDKHQDDVIILVENILKLNKRIEKHKNDVFNYLKVDLNITNFTKKVEEFHVLTNEQFLKELKKKTKKFDETEILSIFENSRDKINSLTLKLEKNNNELNKIIYKIYNLTNEEIKIIEEDT